MGKDISVAVMTFNESENLDASVREIDSTLREINRSYEILIIDDGSTDTSYDVARKLSEELENIRIIRHETNKGLGGVYRTGFSSAAGACVTFFPADGQFSPSIIKQFLPYMDEVDMVLGYLPARKSSFLAKGLSKAEKLLFHLLFGPLPKFQGIMMFKRALLDKVELRSAGRGWVVVTEFIIRVQRSDYKIISLPTEIRSRMSGRSKVNNLCNIWDNFKQAVALRQYL